MNRRLMAAVACTAIVSWGAPTGPALAQVTPSLPPELTKAIANYAALTSYADTGTIVRETPGVVDTAKTTTYLRRTTRDLYIDFQAISYVNTGTKFTIDTSKSRRVMWMFKGEMQIYDFVSGSHELVSAEGGAQVRTLQNASHGTQGMSTLIPALFYSQSRLPGTVAQIEQATVSGIEEVDKRRCHKVVGVAAAYYPSGQRTGVRPVTVWIDVETQLIRKVFEDTPKGYPAQSYVRTTITLQPQGNPVIEDAKFQFKVPEV